MNVFYYVKHVAYTNLRHVVACGERDVLVRTYDTYSVYMTKVINNYRPKLMIIQFNKPFLYTISINIQHFGCVKFSNIVLI
jgi:hypothetical protein